MKLTTAQIAVYVGALLAILIAVLDTWAFGQKFGQTVDLLLLGTGLGGLLGQTIPLVSGAVVANVESGK
jgi:hypothetical protein